MEVMAVYAPYGAGGSDLCRLRGFTALISVTFVKVASSDNGGSALGSTFLDQRRDTLQLVFR
jgi:hypothetical protein